MHVTVIIDDEECSFKDFTVTNPGVVIPYGDGELLIPWHRVHEIYSGDRGSIATLPL